MQRECRSDQGLSRINWIVSRHMRSVLCSPHGPESGGWWRAAGVWGVRGKCMRGPSDTNASMD